MIYSISYDLKNPGQNYDGLIEKIKSLGAWAHPCESYWLVDTQLNSAAVFNILKAFLDGNDVMIVSRFNNDDFSGKVSSDKIVQWINERTERYKNID
ncbi:MAG: hypothetical protein B7Y39_12955 [Bdellovibrio sp. 28-41-41]|nr:MAG: hypothetical protein B7Y39_12955 [Bdellovibrio sp. 28-41-41]